MLQPPTAFETLIVSEVDIPAFRDKRLGSYAGNINAGQPIRVLLVDKDLFFVQANVGGEAREVWVERSRFGPLPEKLRQEIAARDVRRDSATQLIAEEIVAVGMTTAEVEAAVGAPDKVSREATAEGETLVWEYKSWPRLRPALGGGAVGVRPPGGGWRLNPFGGVGVVVDEREILKRIEFQNGIVTKVVDVE